MTADNEATIVESGIEQTTDGYVTNSTLSFDATVEDRGTLVCSAQNVHGAIEASIALVVYGKTDFVGSINFSILCLFLILPLSCCSCSRNSNAEWY